MRVSVLFLVLLAAALALGEPVREPAAPDLLFFSRHLGAEINERCAGCHSDPETSGRFLLTPLRDLERPDPAAVLANYRACLLFLDAERPDRSLLVKKPLGEERHGGGAILAGIHAGTYEKLLHFAMGATLENRPPEAILPRRFEAAAGKPLELDGTLSGDPDGDALQYRWRVAERPAASVSAIAPRGEGLAVFEPDRPGVYRIELEVHDGRLWSLPSSALVVAEAARGPAATPSAPAERAFVDRRLEPQRLQRVRRLFLDLKWRSPTLEEIAAWYDRPHAEMVDAFLADEETWKTWYEAQLFYFLLLDNFRPKEGRLATIPARLAAGEIDAFRALEEIVRSQYFNRRNPGNDTFVTVVLEQCLGVVVQERAGKRLLDLGKKMYDGYRTKLFRETGDSQADFVRICFRQPEMRRHFLRRVWRDLHGDDIDPKRLEADTARLQEGSAPFRDLLREWLTGAAYADAAGARTKPEIPYVRALFVDTLGRTPSYDELRNVRNAFLSLADPTPIRLVMGRVLLESREARLPASAVHAERFVKEQFVRLLARPPSEQELATFSAALRDDPEVTPRVVLWTLISSPEYQSY